MGKYVIATVKSWNKKRGYELADRFAKDKFEFVFNKEDLTVDFLESVKPRYIFFPHWQWIIPEEIFGEYECVVFHMTDLPFGRGGSPLQNLLARGIYQTKISALKVTQRVDAGDVYFKEELDISTGSADEILSKASEVIYRKMIPRFLNEELRPIPQEGEVTVFKRRTPQMSEIPGGLSQRQVYDYIRMLDGEGYPMAYCTYDGGRVYYRNARYEDGVVFADAEFRGGWELKKILVIAAHPDDELLGVGGTVRRFADEGKEVRAVILAEGITSRSESRQDTDRVKIIKLQENARAAARKLGYWSIDFCSLPDNRMDSIDLLDIIKIVGRYIEKYDPDTIFTHHHGDLNIDHRRVCEAVLTASRPIQGCRVERIYAFETPSSSEWNYFYEEPFTPNVYIDVSSTFEVKVEGMACYESESTVYPHPRSADALRALGRYRGSCAGFEMAEGFMLLRGLCREQDCMDGV